MGIFLKIFLVSFIATFVVGSLALYYLNHDGTDVATETPTKSTDTDALQEDTASTDITKSEDKTGTGTPRDTPSAEIAWKTMKNELFNIDMPDVWTEVQGQPKTQKNSKTKTFGYKSDGGGYMAIVVDIEDVGLGMVDQVWYWRVNDSGDGVVIDTIDEEGLGMEGEVIHGDGQLKIMGRHTLNIPEKPIAGHTYLFFFGNGTQEDGVDLGIFKRMLESFRVNL